ncbi:hypothetical protein Hanom_Chr15g01410831 [Helianthus anomalus]
MLYNCKSISDFSGVVQWGKMFHCSSLSKCSLLFKSTSRSGPSTSREGCGEHVSFSRREYETLRSG